MVCCGADSVLVEKMALEVKTGPMLWYKRRFFRSNWRNVYCVLKNDSKLVWYKDKSRHDKDGEMVLKEAPELIAFIPYTSQVLLPYANKVLERHSVSENYVQKKLLAFGVKGKDRVHCFLCPNEEEVTIWMSAILSTIPAPMVPLQFRRLKDQLSLVSSGKEKLSHNHDPHQITGKQPANSTTEDSLKPVDDNLVDGSGIAVSMLLGAAAVALDLANGRQTDDEDRTASSLGHNLDEDESEAAELLQQSTEQSDDVVAVRGTVQYEWAEGYQPYGDDFVGDYYGGDFGAGNDGGGAEYMACFAIF